MVAADMCVSSERCRSIVLRLSVYLILLMKDIEEKVKEREEVIRLYKSNALDSILVVVALVV